jgi:hypothetical protein
MGVDMSKPRKSIPAALVVVGIISAVVAWLVNERIFHSSGDTSVEKALADLASELNKMFPKMLDSETRAETIISEPPNALVYRYTMINRTREQFNVQKLTDTMRPRIINGYKTDEKMRTLREAGVTLKYRYYDKNGAPITEIVVTTTDLK